MLKRIRIYGKGPNNSPQTTHIEFDYDYMYKLFTECFEILENNKELLPDFMAEDITFGLYGVNLYLRNTANGFIERHLWTYTEIFNALDLAPGEVIDFTYSYFENDKRAKLEFQKLIISGLWKVYKDMTSN